LVVLLRESPGVLWHRLSPLTRSFLYFWGGMVLLSLLTGTTVTGDYLYFLSNDPWLGTLWILESWRLWGWGLLIAVVTMANRGDNGSTNKWLFVYVMVLAGLLIGTGVGEYLMGNWLTGTEPFRVLGKRTTNSAKLLNLVLPYLLISAYLPEERSTVLRWLAGGLFVLGGSGLILTGSRAGIASFLVAAVGVVILVGRARGWGWSLKRVVPLLLIPTLVAGAPQFLSPTSPVSSQLDRTVDRGLTESVRYRVIWPLGLRLIADRPILGHGAGTYYRRADRLETSPETPLAKLHPHNVLLQVLYQGGVLVLGLFMYFLYRLVRTTIGVMRHRDRPIVPGDVFLVALLAMVLVHGGFEAVNWGYVCLLLSLYECGRPR
jgi:hypothetical protein